MICINAWRWFGRFISGRVAGGFDKGLEDKFVGILLVRFGLVPLEGIKKAVDAFEEAIVDYTFVLERVDFSFPLESLLVDLVLLRPDEGTLVDIGVHFDDRIVKEFESVPFGVVDGHLDYRSLTRLD